MSGTEYRIDYTITRRQEGEDDFTEIGFGSSGAWESPRSAMFAADSDVSSYGWETSGEMPEPESIKADLEDDDL